MIVYVLIFISVCLFFTSLTVHLLTFTSFCVSEHFPYVWVLHLLIFAVFIPAIFYGKRFSKEQAATKDLIFEIAPKSVKILMGICFTYAIINFILFIILSGGGGPDKRKDGKYYLTSHGKVIKELTLTEYKHYRNVEVRGFSGHWMLFYAVSLMMFAAYLKLQKAKEEGRLDDVIKEIEKREQSEEETKNPLERDREWRELNDQFYIEKQIEEQLYPPGERPYYGQPAGAKAGLTSLLLLIGVIVIIATGNPVLNLIAAVICIVATVLHVKRKVGFKDKSFESLSGCLLVVPAFFLSIMMAGSVRSTVVVWIQKGMMPALTGDVTLISSKSRESVLSTGESVDLYLSGATLILLMFPVVACGIWGMTYLAEVFGRFAEKRLFKSGDQSNQQKDENINI